MCIHRLSDYLTTNRTLLSGHGGTTVIDLDVRLKFYNRNLRSVRTSGNSSKVCKNLITHHEPITKTID